MTVNKTAIEWCLNPDGSQGYTWNPITGCLNGCPYCYARKLAKGRLRQRYLANSILPTHDEPNHEAHHADPFYPRFWEDRLPSDMHCDSKLIRAQGPRGIFVCDMSDLFGIGIPENWTKRIMEIIEANPWHRFYLLTKQPQNLPKFSPFPDNCWVGVTITNETTLLKATTNLGYIDAKVKFISFEPLLERLPLPYYQMNCDWVIIGAQTKPYKPPEIEWVEEIVQACDKAGVPVFLKDNLKLLIQEAGMGKAGWAAREWVQCKYPILRQELPK